MNFYEMIDQAEAIARKEKAQGNLGGIASVIQREVPGLSRGMCERVACEVLSEQVV